MASMKRVIAIILICLPASLSAEGRCPVADAHRAEIARALSAKPTANRVELVRAQKIRAILAWQRAVLFEQQIL
jgi:hypothetical protein